MKPVYRSSLDLLSRGKNIAPFVVAVLVLGFILLTAFNLIGYPDDGIDSLSVAGQIISLQPTGPALGRLAPGDTILSIDGHLWQGNFFSYADLGKKSGQPVDFEILRDGENQSTQIVLAPPSFGLILNRLVSILVALIFWLMGVGVEAFKPSGKGSGSTSMWFLTSALTLTAGAASTMGSAWASILFTALVWILGPLSVQFHMYFPQPIAWKGKQVLLVALYSIALLGVVPLLFVGASSLGMLSWYPTLSSIGRLFLSLSLLIVVGLLYYSYRNSSTPGVRGKVRLVLLGGALVAVPFVVFTILPETLIRQTLIPYSAAFLLLGILPLTYGYAIFRLRLIEIDEKINRGATFILVYSFLGSFYLVLYAVLNRFLPNGLAMAPLVNTILIMVLASLFLPLRQRVQRQVDRVFYGSWYDYRAGVKLITDNLGQITDLNSLARTVCERLVNTLRLEEAVVFLRDPRGDFSVVEVCFSQTERQHAKLEFPFLPRSSLTYLLKIGVVERVTLLQALSQISLTPQELQLLQTEQIHLWVPVIGHGQIQGLLALGPKLGGDVFSADDMDILRVVVQQVGPVVENIHLLTDLKSYASELEKRVEERTTELYDAKERVEAILASVGDGVIVTDLDGHILTVNRAFERLSGYSGEEITGVNLFQTLAAENESTRITAMRESLTSDEIWGDEFIGNRKDGSHYNIRFTIAPVHNPQGATVGYVGCQTDITRLKELDRLKDIFISDVSHELRTPITTIGLFTELLKSAPSEHQQRYLEVIREQSELLTKLVEDILDLSRLTASKSRSVELADVDLNLLVDQVVSAQKLIADAAGLSLVFEPDLELPRIQAEQNQIARLINNLITNAIHYTQSGEVRVKTTKREMKVGLSVQDTGIGIEPGDMPHLFERFYRGQNVRQSGIHGTGLGLAIVKEIVDFHGGEIEVQSESGKGSKFQVWLPENSAPHRQGIV
jgi:two-component system NtrC family sensor kinase